MYVIGELSHTVVAFDLSTAPAEAIQPIDGFAPNIIPSTVHPAHQSMMDSAEICLHPTIPNVLYVSNRWERHIAQREPHLKNVPKELPPGDAVAIILLSDDGKMVKDMKHVRTNVDVIRGMRLSDDGKYVVVVGQEGGGVEIYEISGDKGDVWTLVAGLNEGLGRWNETRHLAVEAEQFAQKRRAHLTLSNFGPVKFYDATAAYKLMSCVLKYNSPPLTCFLGSKMNQVRASVYQFV